MFRFILVVITLFLYLILGIPVLGIEWIISKFNQEAADYQWCRRRSVLCLRLQELRSL